MLSKRERGKSKHKFCGTKVCEVRGGKKIFCKLDFRNTEAAVRKRSPE